ncbi:Lysophospholipase L1-like esterase [Rasamsonia emersonii CBS 393.64]|uniref:Lysophospholipase L1-like esterase n=1 Tax=Rasamsonia emersonii (strain ATCC 16479 / CBS 393.64 / IMI 116815) TaxID=1408163 RepID=A0A0F4YK95_RASE3|nr:Lysophospholipase L1-like esterase [Rasamsonia emersonii CBS 393.64]KKA18560.1 Lysophospholipase L1-like esterase [Rasamsonia emersonii CBS 393.64]
MDRIVGALVLLLGLFQCVNASPSSFTDRGTADANASVVSINNARLKKSGWHWVDTWTAMPQLTEPANLPPPPFNGSATIFFNSTIRQTLHVSLGAEKLRLRVSNAFGITNLTLSEVTIALPADGQEGTSAIQPQTLQQVTFSGQRSVSIPDGGLAVSDPLDFPVKPLTVLSVSIYLADGQQGGAITSHPGSRTTTYFSFGNYAHAANLTDASVQSVEHWYFISAVEVWSPPSARAFAIIGDSITDGRGSDDNKDDRWPDLVLDKMQQHPDTASIAVLNQAAGGNRILQDGLGPNVISRVDRDILAQSGVRYAMIFEGVNDIGVADPDPATQQAIGDSLIAGYIQIAERIHAQGIPFFAATITPFGTPAGSNSSVQPYSNPVREQTRQRINTWIRTSGVFDAVIDFDRIVRDPNDPSVLAPEYFPVHTLIIYIYTKV